MSELSGRVSAEDKDLMTLDMLTALETQYKDQIADVGISEADGTGQVKDGRLYANVSVTGVNDGYKLVNNVEMISGRFINERDLAGRKNLCVVSDKLVGNLFKGGANPVGQEIKLYDAGKIRTYTIAGVYKYSQSALFASTSSEKDMQTSLYIPITVEKQDKAIKNFSTVTVMGRTDADMEKLTKDVEHFFTKYYASNPKWEVAAINMSSMISIATGMLSTVNLAIAVIAAISRCL